MKNTCLLIYFALATLSGFAQDSTKKVKADDDLLQVFSLQDLYRYTDFRNGKVVFRDGSEVRAKLNYNRLFDQFMFIDDRGDSLAIGNAETIRYIIVEKDSFFATKNSFVESLGWYSQIHFTGKQTLEEVDEEKTGAYGQTYSQNATTAKRFYFTVDGKPRLNVGEKMVFKKKNEFYFAYRSDEYMPLNKKNIEKAFSPHSKEIRDYMKNSHTDLTNQSSVRDLFNYIAYL
jgi:hypothetical protein